MSYDDRDGGIAIVNLYSASCLEECPDSAVHWNKNNNEDCNMEEDDDHHHHHNAQYRCRTACWYHDNSTTTNCYCTLDMIWMPKRLHEVDLNVGGEKVDSVRLLWSCQDDSDCSFNGHGQHKTGLCRCLTAWKGIACGELDMLPVDRGRLGFRAVDLGGHNVSSWGAPILWDDESQLWYGFVSKIQGGCGINAWETNSRIRHIIGTSPYGPFQKQEVIFPAFAHEPSVVRDPQTGAWVMLFSSYWVHETQWEEEVKCRNCAGSVTPDVSPRCPFQMGIPKNLSHPFQQMMSTAPTPK